MPHRPAAPGLAPIGEAAPLAPRRAVFAALAGVTMIGLLWLAGSAVPPRGPGAILFLLLFAVTLPWSVVGFWNAGIGFLIMRCARDPIALVNPSAARVRGDEVVTASTAILMCIRDENPDPVIRNLSPLAEGLAGAAVAPLFHIYVLSDSADPRTIAQEEVSFAAFGAGRDGAVPVTYRRRAINSGFKAGNIRDFCERWGAGHDFAVTLDADSVIDAQAVLRLVRVMQSNPTLGILQTLVIGLPSVSAFARLFQFGMRLGMRSYTLGGAWWQGDCGPYWGHNAILRLAPFIEHCRLPELPARGALGGPLLSHDQVEAALMRRAGYEVRVLPVEGLSFEENPPTLLEFIRRDLRWCQGNMQYWRLLGLPGLKPVSRVQLAFAILMYLGSPAWMAMVALGVVAVALGGHSAAPVAGFRTAAGAPLFAIILTMIFAPKIASGVDVLMRRSSRRAYGGGALFVLNMACETLFSFLLSPIMALTHTAFLFRLLALGRGGAWSSQKRQSHAIPWRLAWARLWPHTLAGLAAIGTVAISRPGEVGYALMTAAGLALAAPFAVATAAPSIGAGFARLGVGRIPEETAPPAALLPLNLPAVDIPRRPRPRRPLAAGQSSEERGAVPLNEA